MRIDEDIKLDFKLHPGKFIAEYRSILTMISMRRSKGGKRPVSIRVDHLKSKINCWIFRLYRTVNKIVKSDTFPKTD